MLNANKRSISLNLKMPRGVELFLDLAADADVILENFVPGVVERLGIDYPSVAARNPRIVYASGSGYGQDGPYRDYPAMDLTVQAMSGVMSATGFPDQPPVKAGAAICDAISLRLAGGTAPAPGSHDTITGAASPGVNTNCPTPSSPSASRHQWNKAGVNSSPPCRPRTGVSASLRGHACCASQISSGRS